MVNSPLIRPYFLGGGGIGRVPLGSHDMNLSFLPITHMYRPENWIPFLTKKTIRDECTLLNITKTGGQNMENPSV